MNEQQNIFDDFIKNYPRESLQLLLMGIFLIWQVPVGVLAILLYVILSKLFKLRWWIVLGVGSVIALGMMGIQAYRSPASFDLAQYLVDGFTINKVFFKGILANQAVYALYYWYQNGLDRILGLPILLAGILSIVDLIQDSPHQKAITALQKGEHLHIKKELSESKTEAYLLQIDEGKYDGTVLGVSKYTGTPVVIPDYFINQVMLVLGTTGSGKTITLCRFYRRAITKGYPIIIVDGKPSAENVEWVQGLAEKHNRKFYGFNCGNYAHYDPLSDGGYTELKDKVISLKDEWENDYYKSIAEDYLQAVFQVLIKIGQPFDLKRVVECLDHNELLSIVRELDDRDLLKRVVVLGDYDKKDITGLRAHLNLLVHSELGAYFSITEKAFSLRQAITDDAVVYFALPALKFPSFSKVLGKLVINDLKAVIDSHNHGKRVFMIFDEFSVFAGEQVLNLVSMGRGKGVHAIFGTQGLADLSRVDAEFRSQVLNCANTIICHRLNDQESAESVSAWMGTYDTFTLTAQFDPKQKGLGLGSISADKAYVVHPESIKQGLRTGEAFFVSKVGRPEWEKVRVCN
jgi:type IV secretory pathway TraG/TraD family ATPase VirD4